MTKFLIITNVAHIKENSKYFGYAPYVSEMNIWLNYVEYLTIIAPIKKEKTSAIDLAYNFNDINFKEVPDFNFTTIKDKILSLFKLPIVVLRIFLEMHKADHIHLRCPGNMGLIGCFVQIFFPRKIKTAKYAGNWDFESKQPFTYSIQKRILKNTFLTRNMQVLVYGDWKNQSKNVKSFFTATYSESEKEIITKKDINEKVDFMFVGSLVSGKNPLYAIQLIEKLAKKKSNLILNLYGGGAEEENLQKYVQEKNLKDFVIFHGNKNKETIKKAYQKSHFVLLPSKSEGWPKAIAEGMFWGCVPIATKVSCVPFMLDYGKRGILLEMDLEKDVNEIFSILENENIFSRKSKLAVEWSQHYTTDLFEAEIKTLLQK